MFSFSAASKSLRNVSERPFRLEIALDLALQRFEHARHRNQTDTRSRRIVEMISDGLSES